MSRARPNSSRRSLEISSEDSSSIIAARYELPTKVCGDCACNPGRQVLLLLQRRKDRNGDLPGAHWNLCNIKGRRGLHLPRHRSPNPVAVEQPQGFVQPLPTPPLMEFLERTTRPDAALHGRHQPESNQQQSRLELIEALA
jgi:hypothetical protein